MDYKSSGEKRIECSNNIFDKEPDFKYEESELKPTAVQFIFGIVFIVTAIILLLIGIDLLRTAWMVAAGVVFLIGIFLLSYNLQTLFSKSDFSIDWAGNNSKKDSIQNDSTTEIPSASQPKKKSKTLYVAANVIWAAL